MSERSIARSGTYRRLRPMTPPAPPPCVACGQDSDFQRRQAIKICDVESENRQLKFDLESAQSINERKDARIRELVGALKSTLTPFQLANTHLAECMGEDYTVRLKYEQMTAEAFHQVQAALARSSEVPK